MHAISNRAVAVATAVAVMLTTSGIPAFAASKSGNPAQVKEATVTDLSAAKKKRYRARRGLDPAGRAFLGIAGAMFGAAAAGIAADNYRERYWSHRPYGYYGYGYPYYYNRPRFGIWFGF